MTIAYKLLKTGGKLPKNKDLRVVVHENMTVGMDRMGKNIEKATTLTTADLTGSLDALKAEIAYQLMEGNRVHLPGLGYFSLAVKGEICEDAKTHRFRLRNPEVRSVNFRPEKDFMRTLRNAKFENATYRSRLHATPSPAEVDTALTRLFAAADYIFANDLQTALHLSKSMTYRLLRSLESEDKLRNVGSRYRKMYVKG